MVETRISASLGEYAVPAVVHAVQGDTGRVFVFEIKDYALASGDTASLICRRPDGSIFSYAGEVDTSLNTVTCVLDSEGGAFTQDGVVAVQLVLNTDGVVRSFKMGVIVEENISGEATPEDITFLDGLQAQLDAWIAGAQALFNAKVDKTTTVNGKALSADVTLTPSDIGAVPTSRTVNNKALSNNIVLGASDFASGEMASLEYEDVASWSGGKSIKVKDNTFWDASGVTYGDDGTTLSSLLTNSRSTGINIAANGSRTVTCPNNGKALMFTVGGNDAVTGMWLVNVTSTGTVTVFPIKSASALTLTTGTNSLTVSSSSTVQPRLIIYGYYKFTIT